MKPAARRDSKDEVVNAVAASPTKTRPGRSTTKGELPPSLSDRYLIERDRLGRSERFYRDRRSTDPMFRDEGKRLVSHNAYPDTVADMMKIAKHRGWNQVRVTGDEAFRREAWIQAQALGLKVKGYAPRDRDRQAADYRTKPSARSRDQANSVPTRDMDQRLKAAAVVVRRIIPDPAAQARLLERAHTRARQTLPKEQSPRSYSPDRARTRR